MEPNIRLKPVKEFRIYKRNLPHFELAGSIKFHANKKYRLYACVVIETHVHSILQPLEGSDGTFYSLSQIMHSIKSYSANRIQRLLNKKGNVWLDENYDRIIRDDEEYLGKMNYIINNPLKAGLVEKPENYRWLFFEGSG